MEIFHGTAQLERAQHIAVDIDITIEVRVTYLTFVDALDRAQTLPVFYCHTEAWRVGCRNAAGSCRTKRHRMKPARLKSGRQIDQAYPRLQFSKCELMC